MQEREWHYSYIHHATGLQGQNLVYAGSVGRPSWKSEKTSRFNPNTKMDGVLHDVLTLQHMVYPQGLVMGAIIMEFFVGGEDAKDMASEAETLNIQISCELHQSDYSFIIINDGGVLPLYRDRYNIPNNAHNRSLVRAIRSDTDAMHPRATTQVTRVEKTAKCTGKRRHSKQDKAISARKKKRMTV